MRKILSAIRACVVSACLASVLAFAACSNDIDSASTTAGMDNSADDDMALNDNDGKSDKANRNDTNTGSESDNSGGTVKDFGDNFIRGFDASAVDYFENVYASSNTWTDKNWYDSDGSKDIFALLADHGFNTIRLRVWVDPTVTSTISNDSVWPTSTSVENAWKNGDCTKERATRLAKRAKAAGMKVLLDFHLSDYWTDPSVQLIPKSWQSVTSAGEMKEKLTSHITEVLQYMKDNSVMPDYVQVGNEIDRGMLVDASVDASTSPKTATSAASSISGGINSENFKTYLKAGCAAVRDFDEDIKIIIHITAKNSDRFSYVKNSGADYDIIGLSYYSWENHGTIDELVTKIGNLESTYSKKVMVVETSFAALDYGDSDDMTQAATNLSAKNYSDVTIESNAVVPSEDVQKAILRHTMQEVYGAGGIGICIWGGERRDYQFGLFDWDGNTYKAIDAFNYNPSDGYPAEDASDAGGSEETETGSSSDNTGESAGSNSSTDEENSGDTTDDSSDGTGGGTSEETMSIELTLAESIGATSVTLTYYDDESLATDSVTGAVSNNTVTLKVSNSYANEWAFENMKLEITGTNTDNLTMSSADSNFGGNSDKFWFKFESDSTLAVTVNRDVSSYTTLCEEKAITIATDSDYVQVLEASAFAGLSIGTLKVTVLSSDSGAWASLSSKGSWADDGTYVQNCVNTTTTLTSSDYSAFITALSENGLYIQGSAASFTVTVTYAE